MRIENHINVLAGSAQEAARIEKLKEGKTGGQTVFAGNLRGDFSLLDRVRQRKDRARERAMKVVNDAWGGDRQLDDEIGRSRDRIKELRQHNNELRNELKELAEKSEKLTADYHIEEDSAEQQDLELLKKANGARYSWSGLELTDEEKARVKEIMAGGLTAYQERALELDRQTWGHRDAVYRNELEITQENAIIRGVREARRKVHPMLDAQKRAEEIEDAAREEIVGMAVAESKEHLDEAQEERQEQAEEIKEEQEKREEILEEREEREDALEELAEGLAVDNGADVNQTLSEVRRQIQGIVNEMNLVIEDIKGAQVDTGV